MDFIYLLTGLCTVIAAIAGLVLTCYLERRWLTSRRLGSGDMAPRDLEADGLSTCRRYHHPVEFAWSGRRRIGAGEALVRANRMNGDLS